MITAEILRLEKYQGTFGVLLLDFELFCWTIERPWADNLPNVSCIPEGDYFCERHDSPKFGDTFEVMSVPNRSLILFHPANYVEDLQGCVGLGKEIGWMGQKRMVKESKDAFTSFMKKLEGETLFKLRIKTF